MGRVKVRGIDSLGAYLRDQRRNAELSLRQLADLTGVSNPYLSQIERGLRKPSAEVLQQLAKSLRISAEALYVRAGLLDPNDDSPDDATEAAIRADTHLTERQKHVLLDIYASFRHENADGERAEAGASDASAEAAGESHAFEGAEQDRSPKGRVGRSAPTNDTGAVAATGVRGADGDGLGDDPNPSARTSH